MTEEWVPPAPAPTLEESRRFAAAVEALAAAGVDVEAIDHLDVDDVVLPVDVFEQLAIGYVEGLGIGGEGPPS